MIRGVCLAICLVAFILGDATVARADVSRGERRTTIDSPRLLTRAIEDRGLLLPPPARAKFRRPWDAPQGLMSTQLRKCGSRKQGMIIGAVIGAAAGAAIGVVVARQVSSNASNGDAAYITYWTLGGAGVGALAGLASCR